MRKARRMAPAMRTSEASAKRGPVHDDEYLDGLDGAVKERDAHVLSCRGRLRSD